MNLGPTVSAKGGYLDGREVGVLERFRFGGGGEENGKGGGGERKRGRGGEGEEGEGGRKRVKME